MDAGDLFLFTRRLSGTAENPCRENSPLTRYSTSCAPVSDAFGSLSASVGESGESAPTPSPRRAGRHLLSGAVPAVSPLQWFFPAGSGIVPFIPLSPWIQAYTDDGGTMADPCD